MRPPVLWALALLWVGGCGLGFSASESPPGDDDAADDDDDGDDDNDAPPDDDTADDDGEPTDDDDSVSADDDASDDDAADDDAADDDDTTTGVDRDEDGYPEGEDCDDWIASVNPGATEIACDSHDNDCDGAYAPEDIDDDGDSASECFGDCDDSAATVYDGAPEVECDGVDQNCDGADSCGGGGGGGGGGGTPPALPGSICAGATPLPFGTVGAGSLSGGDRTAGAAPDLWYYDPFAVHVAGVALFSADVASWDFDAWVEVYDETCTFVTSDDDGLGGTDASAWVFPPWDGWYFVMVTSYGPLETGAYQVQVW